MQNSQLEKSREICGEYNCAILITTQFLILIFQIDLQIFRTYRLTILSFFFPSFLSFSSSPFFFFFFFKNYKRSINFGVTKPRVSHKVSRTLFLFSSFPPSFFFPFLQKFEIVNLSYPRKVQIGCMISGVIRLIELRSFPFLDQISSRERSISIISSRLVLLIFFPPFFFFSLLNRLIISGRHRGAPGSGTFVLALSILHAKCYNVDTDN